ncbi:MAG: hypothetical protein AB8H79_15525 [Myxococcota bacterium]
MRSILFAMMVFSAPASAFDDDYSQYSGSPPPPDQGDQIGLVDHMGVIIARPRPEAFLDGLSRNLLDTVVAEAMAHRDERYDFAVVVHTPSLPHPFTAAAFHRAYNNSELAGIGTRAVTTPYIRTRSVLWMNDLNYWDSSFVDHVGWIFAHEVSHYWLARPVLPGQDPTALLGRQAAHWSYYVHTTNSPIEGNAWIDNGDGTFTTDDHLDSTFSELDLYLMGMGEAEDVPDFFYIKDPVGSDKDKESTPQHITSHYGRESAVTVSGTRVDVSVEDLIAANGPRRPSVAESPTRFRMLPIFIVGPDEHVESAHLERIDELTQVWTEGWSHYTRERSSCTFAIEEEWVAPPMNAPSVTPKGAW